MLRNILILTEPQETASLMAALDGLSARLRTSSDLEGDLASLVDARKELRREAPDLVVLGDTYPEILTLTEALRLEAPGSRILLLAERDYTPQAFAFASQNLGLLLRPVAPIDLCAAVLQIFPEVTPKQRPASSASMGLLRVDDMVEDPLALLRITDMLPDPLAELATPAPPPPEEAPSPPQPGRRGSTVSGQFEQVLVPKTPPPSTKVAVDASMYEPRQPAVSVDPSLYTEVSPKGDSGPRRSQGTPPPIPRSSRESAQTRPPPVPLPMPQEGDLHVTDPPTLVGWLCTTGFTGCLQLLREPADGSMRALYFDGGELVAASSTLSVDSLPELLYHEGRLSREQLKRARAHIASLKDKDIGNRRLAQQLSDQHLLPKADITPLLRRHVIEIFYRCFSWEKGRYRLSAKGAPMEDRVRLKETPRLLLLEGLRRKAGLDSLIQRVGPETTVLTPVGSGGLLLRDAGVTAFEQRALPLFDGTFSLLQISQKSGLAEHATYVLAYALICLGGLRRQHPAQASPSQQEHPALPPPSSRPRLQVPSAQSPMAVSKAIPLPKEEAPPASPNESVVLETEAKKRIRDKYLQVEASDYFTLLGISPDASESDIGAAYKNLMEAYSPDHLPPLCRTELAREITEIGSTLKEAYTVLSDEAMRTAYKHHLLPLREDSPEAASERN